MLIYIYLEGGAEHVLLNYVITPSLFDDPFNSSMQLLVPLFR